MVKSLRTFLFFFFFLVLALSLAGTCPAADKDAAPQTVKLDEKWGKGNAEVLKLFNEKKYDKALKECQGLLQYLKKAKLLGSREEATTYNNLGMAYMMSANFAKAEENLRKALEIRVKLMGPDSMDVASTLLNLSHVYRGQAEHIISQHKKDESVKGKAPAAKK